MPNYRVTFADDGRIGRSRGNGPVSLSAVDYDDLAEKVFKFARPNLGSRWPDVTIWEDGDGSVGGNIFCGMQSAAKFKVETVP